MLRACSGFEERGRGFDARRREFRLAWRGESSRSVKKKNKRSAESNRGVRARARAYRYAWEKLTVGNLTRWRDGEATPGRNDEWKGIPTLASHGDRRLIFMIVRSSRAGRGGGGAARFTYQLNSIQWSMDIKRLDSLSKELLPALTTLIYAGLVNVHARHVNPFVRPYAGHFKYLSRGPSLRSSTLRSCEVWKAFPFRRKLLRYSYVGPLYFAYSCYVVDKASGLTLYPIYQIRAKNIARATRTRYTPCWYKWYNA